MTFRAVIYGLFCARHKKAVFIRWNDPRTSDFAFGRKHRDCLLEVGRWVLP